MSLRIPLRFSGMKQSRFCRDCFVVPPKAGLLAATIIHKNSYTVFLMNVFKNIILVVLLTSNLSCSGTLNISQGSFPPTNVEVMAHLTQRIAQFLIDVASVTQHDTCHVQFVQTEDLQFLEHAFIESVRKASSSVTLNTQKGGGSIHFNVQLSRATVQYENMFRVDLFGEKKVERIITIELSSRVVKNPSENVLFAGMKKEQFRDTVNVDSIDDLESPTIQATHASVPSEPFLDRIVEPFVIITAGGVLIYLLFTVRS